MPRFRRQASHARQGRGAGQTDWGRRNRGSWTLDPAEYRHLGLTVCSINSAAPPHRCPPTPSPRRTRRSAARGCCRGAAYVDPAVFDWEQAQHLRRMDVPGARREVTPVGAQTAVETGADGVLLVRGEDGALRAFRQRLPPPRPRAAARAGRRVKRQSIVCPYHAWNYKLDGTLRNAPGGFRDVEAFDKASSGWSNCGRGVARLGVRRPERRRGPFAEHVGGLEDDRRATTDARGPGHRRAALLRASRPTGRSSSRTTRSATTARRSTPSCAGSARRPSGENLEPRRRLGRRLDGPARRRRDDVARRPQRRRRDPRPRPSTSCAR